MIYNMPLSSRLPLNHHSSIWYMQVQILHSVCRQYNASSDPHLWFCLLKKMSSRIVCLKDVTILHFICTVLLTMFFGQDVFLDIYNSTWDRSITQLGLPPGVIWLLQLLIHRNDRKFAMSTNNFSWKFSFVNPAYLPISSISCYNMD